MISTPIAFVHPRRCVVRYPIQRGEIRRCALPGTGAVYAYDVGCPRCGARNIWMTRRVPIVEGRLVEERPPVEDEEDREDDPLLRPFRRPATVTSPGCACVGCGHHIAIEANTITSA